MTIHGGCHCGNVSFELRWPDHELEIAARACTCTFCRAHGAMWTSHPRASLRVDIADPARLSAYEFATRSCRFRVCARCGLVPFVSCAIDGRNFAIVNTSTFRDVDSKRICISHSSFEGEAIDARLERRKRTWIADLTLTVR